jgi:dethiobiotin synthetase
VPNVYEGNIVIEWFVTGTDTEVGKTTVACALLDEAAGRGLETCALKPVESGCELGPEGGLIPKDATRLREAMTAGLALDEVCSFRYAMAVAPGVAAQVEGGEVELAAVAAALDRARGLACDLLLVEGAGGLIVPLAAELTMADLIAHLGLPTLVVARDGLGTINHTVLSLEALRSRGVTACAVILCGAAGEQDEAFVRSNASEIEKWGRAPVLGWLPWQAGRVRPIGGGESVFDDPRFT